jgi:L-amino acid N-acyltransferase YncA
MADYEAYREAVAASEPFDPDAAVSWLKRPCAPPDEFFLVGITEGEIVADMEFYRDEEDGTLRFDIVDDHADREAYVNLLRLGLDRVPKDLRSVSTSSAQRLADKCLAITDSGFQYDSQTILMSAAIKDADRNARPVPEGLAIFPLRPDRQLSDFTELHNAVFGTVVGARQIRLSDMNDMVSEGMRAGQSIFVAEIGGMALGWIWSSKETENGSQQLFVESIGVRWDYCRRGIGSALVAAALADADDTGIGRVLASVDHGNEGSIRFFEQIGLRSEGVTNWYVRRFNR